MRSRSIFAPFITLLVISASALSQAAGSLDQSFGMGGTEVILAPVIGGTVQRDAVIQSDGKIVSLVSDQFSGATLIRIEPGGILDASFAGDGILETNWQLGPTLPKGLPQAMAIDGLGRLVVGGWWWVPQGSKKYVEMLRIDRYMPDGSRDLNFGTNGTVLFNRPYAVAIAVQSDGKIVVVGNSSVMRFHDNGNPDTSFGNSGTASSGLSNVYSLKLLSDGKILAAGDHTSGSDSSMCVTRINANGSLDQGFGTAGRASANFFGRGSYARANRVDLDPFGNIIAGGFARRKNSVEQDVAAARRDQGRRQAREGAKKGRKARCRRIGLRPGIEAGRFHQVAPRKGWVDAVIRRRFRSAGSRVIAAGHAGHCQRPPRVSRIRR